MSKAKRDQAPAEPARCRACGAPVIRALSHNGVGVRVDAEPSDFGTLALTPRRLTAEPLAYRPTATQRIGTPVYRPHAETCPAEVAARRPSWPGVVR